jgi:hypothetical protein
MREIINEVINNKTLKKIVFSKPVDKSVMKTTGTLFEKNGQLYIQLETFTKDDKALHKNIEIAECVNAISEMAENEYNQTDIITTAGNCNIMRSKKGKLHIVNNIKSGEAVEVKSHNKVKSHLLDGSEAFLFELGISDKTGRIYDKKQAKFKQINRFLELLNDVAPERDTLTIYDLCCGKSYLTFAVYHYFTAIKNRTVTMFGIDLKSDVIEKCNAIAEKLGYSGLKFFCEDINKYEITTAPDIVISLHACDIATDIVLAKAVKSNAKIILSTPCCHHEMATQIESGELEFITQYGILKQKLCDVATDALRCKRLEIEDYKVEAIELIDPDETPKNVMIRAVKSEQSMSMLKRFILKDKYDKTCELLNVKPYLDVLLMKN